MDEEKDEIAKLLEEYQKQRSSKESSREPDAPLPPPVRRTDIIDFAKKDEEPAKSTKGKKREKTPEEQEALLQKKQERKENLKNFAKNTLMKIKAALENGKMAREVELNEEETQKLQNCVDIIKDAIKNIGE